MKKERFWEKINKLDKSYGIMIISFFILIILGQTTSNIVIDYSADSDGTIKLYYNNYQKSIFNETSSTKYSNILVGNNSVKIYVPFCSMNNVRYDVDLLDRITISEIKYKVFGITFKRLKANEIWDIQNMNDVNLTSKSIGYELLSSGSDTFIHISIEIKGILLLYIFVCLLISVCISFFYKKFYKKFPNINIANWFVFIILSLFILLNFYKVYDKVNDIKTVHYILPENKILKKEVQDAQLSSEFNVVGKDLLALDIYYTAVDRINGSIDYSIIEMDNNNIILNDRLQITEGEKLGKIRINVSSINFIKNNRYLIKFNMKLQKPVEIDIDTDNNIQMYQTYKFGYKMLYTIVLIILNLLFIGLLFWFLYKPDLYKNFIILAIFTGVISVFINVPNSIHDEFRHFIRAYHIANGNLFATTTSKEYIGHGGGSEIPVAIAPEEVNDLRLLDTDLNKNENEYYDEVNTHIFFEKYFDTFSKKYSGKTENASLLAVFSIPFLAYIPQVIFILIAKIFHMSIMGIYLMSRLGNVCFSIISMAWVIKKVPKYKNICFVLYFIPELIWLRSSCSTDSFLFSLFILILGYVLYIKENKLNVINIKRIIFLTVMGIFIAIIKLPYILIMFSLLILEKDNFKKEENILLKKIMLSLGMISIILVSYKILSIFTMRNITIIETNGLENTVLNALKVALNTPLQSIHVILSAMFHNSYSFLWKTIDEFSINMSIIYLIFLIVISCFSGSSKKFFNKEKIIYAGIAILIYSTLFFIGFFWSGDFKSVKGLQGRYFLPIIPLILFILAQDYGKKIRNMLSKIIPIVLVNIIVVYYVRQIFIGWI